jgi:hypothetical protein
LRPKLTSVDSSPSFNLCPACRVSAVIAVDYQVKVSKAMKKQDPREGVLGIGDASLFIREESQTASLKKSVFTRITQQLNRLGFALVIPEDHIKQYGLRFARDHRVGIKNQLHVELSITGRCIDVEFFQNENFENTNGGKYDFGKEKLMPYLIWLEFVRSRNRLLNYISNVFGYDMPEIKNYRSDIVGPGRLTAYESVMQSIKESSHYNEELGHATIYSKSQSTSVDKLQINHGQQVYVTDRKQRIVTGTAYHNLNNMWWVVLGKYQRDNKSSGEIWIEKPGDLRKKLNDSSRRTRLENLMNNAVSDMDFLRAHKLKCILFPEKVALFVIQKGDLYFKPNSQGYTSQMSDAGKYTREELKHYQYHNELKFVEVARA